MSAPAINRELAHVVLAALREWGCGEVCVSPGARNAPLIEALTEARDGFEARYFYDERSAAFFALGRIRASGRPVAVLTTSGTAAGELLPAVMEAHYSGLPLILLTADRPRHFRGTAAPQTAEQVGLFGVYAHGTVDLATAAELPSSSQIGWDRDRPLHLNACFDEPLLPASAPAAGRAEPAPGSDEPLATPFADWRHPLVVVGALTSGEQPVVREFLRDLGAPVYCEALSGLREDAALADVRIHSGDDLVARARASGYPVDGFLRIGSIPTLREWRNLEDRYRALPVISATSLPFSGLGRRSELRGGSLARSLAELRGVRPAGGADFLAADRARHARLELLLAREPASEPAMFRALSERIGEGARVFVGNSLPIREWDLAASTRDRGLEVLATRGLNGIDGQVSTFLGLAQAGRANWGIFGDLTTLYDLGAPWVLPQLGAARAQIVVVNNGGGKIFSRMFADARYQNAHDLTFGAWADLWRIRAERWTTVPADLGSVDQNRVIELCPDARSTRRFWQELSA